LYLGLIETRYDYQMSYLDQWKSAWLNASTKSEVFNLAQSGSLKKLSSKIRQFDLIVVLHTVTADSNSWLEKLSKLSDRNRAAMVMFIGNEFSSPFLSTEKRLDLISQISPEFIASQLPIDSAKWLYEWIGSKVIAAPPGMPVLSINNSSTSHDLDLGFRGFRYPWYLMDNERNSIVDQVIDVFKNRNLAVDVSHEKRLNSSEWFDFLSRSRFTVSSEAGAKYIFRDDQIWNPVKEYFATEKKFSALENDVGGMSLLRRLPAPLKSILKKFLSNLGLNQGSLYKPDSKELEKLISLVDLEKYESRNGKCISSRHFDAIAAGTWQILAPGKYNDLLVPNIHFTPYGNPNDLRSLIENEVSRKSLSIQAFDDLSQNHSYGTRVNTVLREIG
jgi:hypothetical protein